LRAGLLAAPVLLLGIVGTTHPMHLTPATAHHWFAMHLAGLFVVPLIGVALAWLVRGRRDLVAVVAVVAAYVFATAYSALDVISGIGNGYVIDRLGVGTPRPTAVNLMFHIGTQLGDVGAWALFAGAVLVGADAVRRHGAGAAPPTLLLLAGSWFLRTQHIFPPLGVLSCVAIGVGTGWLAWIGRSSDVMVAGGAAPAPDR
ncbi:MAG: hypothetical protein ABI873_10675, partial [Marmoricola sp.]